MYQNSLPLRSREKRTLFTRNSNISDQDVLALGYHMAKEKWNGSCPLAANRIMMMKYGKTHPQVRMKFILWSSWECLTRATWRVMKIYTIVQKKEQWFKQW